MKPTRREPLSSTPWARCSCSTAMGSLLYERGVFVTQNFEQLNVTRPDIVRKIHADYVEAGAQVIETNTFGANRFCLERHGLVGEVRAFNLAGARIAREVAGRGAYVAGSVGPTGLVPGVSREWRRSRRAADTFAEQARRSRGRRRPARARDLPAPRRARDRRRRRRGAAAPGLPILAVGHLRRGRHGGRRHRSRAGGRAAARAWASTRSASTAATGRSSRSRWPSACAARPAALRAAERRPAAHRRRPAALHGHARVLRRVRAPHDPGGRAHGRRLLRHHAGAHALDGQVARACSGGGDEAVARVTARRRGVGAAGRRRADAARRAQRVRRQARGREVRGLGRGQPARPGSIRKPRSRRRRCCSTAASTSSTSPTGRAPRRACATSRSAPCCSSDYGIEPIMHVCGRDRNLLGQMAHLLGAHALGMRNLVIITGDPPKVGDYPEATAVYDLDSIGLLADGVEHEPRASIRRASRSAGGQTSFLCATGPSRARRTTTRRSRASSRSARPAPSFVMTQPVFQPDVLERVLRDIAQLGMPVLVGVLPLVSYKNAEFLHNEVPGMQIPEPIRERMRKAAARRRGAQGGRRDRARDAVRGARPRAGRLPDAAARPVRARARGARRAEALGIPVPRGATAPPGRPSRQGGHGGPARGPPSRRRAATSKKGGR